MEIEILDEILEYLLFIQNVEKPYVVHGTKRDSAFIKYDKMFFRAAINKLLKDEYITLGTNVKTTTVSPSHLAGLCDITFEGILFIKSGGYLNHYSEAEKKDNAYANLQDEQRKQSKALVNLNRWIVFGALIVAIDSIMNILNYFGITFSYLQQCLKR